MKKIKSIDELKSELQPSTPLATSQNISRESIEYFLQQWDNKPRAELYTPDAVEKVIENEFWISLGHTLNSTNLDPVIRLYKHSLRSCLPADSLTRVSIDRHDKWFQTAEFAELEGMHGFAQVLYTAYWYKIHYKSYKARTQKQGDKS